MTAEDRMSPEVQSAVDRVNKQYRGLQNSQRAVGRGFELQHRTFSDTARTLTSIGRVAQNVTSIYQRYNIMQLRLIESARDLKDAQRDLNQSLAQYGPNSEHARRAAERLADVQRQNQALQQENTLNNIGLGLSALTSVGTFTRGRGFGTIAGRVGRLFGRGGTPPLTGALRGAAGGGALAGAGGAAAKGGIFGAAAVGGLLAGSQIGRLGLQAVYGQEEGERRYQGVLGQLGLAPKQTNQIVNINTNEIGVTADDILNSSDVFG